MTERPMIENGDRGITLNKSLAWTIACGLIAVGLYVGLQVATLSTRIESMAEFAQVATAERQNLGTRITDMAREHNERLNALERSEARSSEQYSAILAIVTKIDSRLERIETGGKTRP